MIDWINGSPPFKVEGFSRSWKWWLLTWIFHHLSAAAARRRHHHHLEHYLKWEKCRREERRKKRRRDVGVIGGCIFIVSHESQVMIWASSAVSEGWIWISWVRHHHRLTPTHIEAATCHHQRRWNVTRGIYYFTHTVMLIPSFLLSSTSNRN